jgi:hypothetical protein
VEAPQVAPLRQLEDDRKRGPLPFKGFDQLIEIGFFHRDMNKSQYT